MGLAWLQCHKGSIFEVYTLPLKHTLNPNGFRMELYQDVMSLEKLMVTKKSNIDGDLTLVFGLSECLDDTIYPIVSKNINSENVVFCSTSGHFIDQSIEDQKLVISSFKFDHTEVRCESWNINDYKNETEIGQCIGEKMNDIGLSHMMIFADGHLINSDLLMAGVNISCSNKSVSLSGGIAGDGVQFSETKVGLNKSPSEGEIVAIGFYGDRFITESCLTSGFQSFGPKREVTRSNLNVLEYLDGEPALDLYKKYLGDLANDLPGSALYFPLAIYDADGKPTIRTILDVNEQDKTMTFAGNIPKGSKVSLMRANIDVLLDSAEELSEEKLSFEPEHIFITSCVGRRVIMEGRTNEELMIIQDAYPDAPITGFYSYGEICLDDHKAEAILHNQTMVVTYMAEV